MEMMGGEFCGNAARTFALMTAEQKGIRQGTVPVEISGCGKVLLARVDRDRGESSVEMPLPRETDWLEWRGYGRFPLVRMEGICHVIVQGKTLSREEVRELAEETVRREETEAAGVLFLDENRMRPAVYVKETDSLVYESSCGSGSVAAAVWLSQGQPDGIWNCELKQPGGVITVSVTRKDGRVTACSIGGPVRLGEEQETEIVLSGQPEIG